jgi:hypothetical protein
VSEDNITALFRCTVAQARAEGKEEAYRDASRLLDVLYGQADRIPISLLKTLIDATRSECEVQANVAHNTAHLAGRRLARAGMELRDDTTPR